MLANLQTATHPHEIEANDLKLQVLEFLRKRFNIYSAAMAHGIQRRVIYKWIDEDAEFKRALDEIRDGWLDGCEEANFREGAQDKNAVAQRYGMLKAYRPHLFGDRVEVNQNVTVSMNFNSLAEGIAERLRSGTTGQIEGGSITVEEVKSETGKTQ